MACPSVPEDTYVEGAGRVKLAVSAFAALVVGVGVRLWRPVPMLALVVTALDVWLGLSRRLIPRRGMTVV